MGCSASSGKQVKQPSNPPANPAQRQQPAQQNKGANPQSEPVKKEENKKVEKVEKDDKVAKEKSKTKNEENKAGTKQAKKEDKETAKKESVKKESVRKEPPNKESAKKESAKKESAKKEPANKAPEKKEPQKAVPKVEEKPKPKSVKIGSLNNSDFEKLKGSLFLKTMLHELKLSGEYEDSLEERVARLLTNDFGETLRTEVSYSLLQEFKKFMFLVALDILETKRNGDFHESDFEEDKKLNKIYYISPYSPPYTIDLVWRFLIQEGKIYSDFCNSICGGYIDRPNPNIDYKSTLTRYESARIKLEGLDSLVKPYWGLWPNLNSTDQLAIDYEYDMLFHTKEKVNQLLELADKVKEQTIDEFQIVIIRNFIDDWRNEQLNNLEDVETEELDEDADISKYSKRKNIDHIEIYNKLRDFEFHQEFINSICKMFMLNQDAGRKFITEYKNFLYMYYLTECKCAPSFEIDSFWDLHYASTKDYRKFCYDIFGEFLPSKNYDYNAKGIRNRAKDYKLSLEFYEVLFNTEPNEILWESAVDLTINSKNGFQHVNLFKYICICIYGNINQGFEYKNTIRRSKNKAYDADELERILERNKIKLKYAKGNSEFVQLNNHRIVDNEESIDEDDEREEAEKAVDEESIAVSEILDVDEHPNGNDYKLDRLKEAISQKGGKAPSHKDSDDEDAENNKKSSRDDSTPKIIYDPILTKGGFKILPQYHNTLIFDSDDLIDKVEDGLYKDHIHKGSKKFKDIFDAAVLSRADVDVLFLPGINKDKKESLGLHKLLLDQKLEDINFEFDPNEKFKPKQETVVANKKQVSFGSKDNNSKSAESDNNSQHSSLQDRGSHESSNEEDDSEENSESNESSFQSSGPGEDSS